MPSTGSAKSKLRPSGKSTERKHRHLRVTPIGGAVSRQSSNEKVADDRFSDLSHSPESALSRMEAWPGEVSITIHRSPGAKPLVAVTNSAVSVSRHTSKNRENASCNEQFIHPLVRTFGRETAEFLAARFGYSLQQPSQESPANSNGRGRNYSAQNAKRKPLSGSSASSRKRS